MTFLKPLLPVFLLCAVPAAADEAQRDLAREIAHAALRANETPDRPHNASPAAMTRTHSIAVDGCQVKVKSVSRRHDGAESSIDEVTFDLARASLPVSPEEENRTMFEIEFAPRYKPTAYTTTYDATTGLPVSYAKFEMNQAGPGRLLTLLTEYQERYCAPGR